VSSSLHSADEQRLAERVVRKMLERDAFSAWLGLELLEVRPRYAAVRMTVRRDMLNGFGVCHGGVTFALADSAFAFASNTHGRVTVSIDNSITYPAAISAGDVLTAVAIEESAASRLAFYGVRVTNQHDGVVALFRGTVYRTQRGHFAEDNRDERVDEAGNA
jgi:acyl-CoA thioesterase